jgi:ribosome-associated heat shock protein Hsp15
MSGDEDGGADRLRIDRWLWCARFFKSRSAAAEAVRAGRVRLNGGKVKPAHDVKPGDAVAIELGAHGEEREITIAAIPARRGPASEAALCYVESSESVERRRAAAEARALAPPRPTPGRPDKRTRRLLLRARDRR